MHRLDGNPVLRKMLTALFMAGVVVALPSVVEAQSLGGSKASMDRQNQQARAHDFTFLRDGNQVRTFANSGLLVRLTGDDNYQLAGVSYPYARPEVKLFVERLSSQYANWGQRVGVAVVAVPRRLRRAARHYQPHPAAVRTAAQRIHAIRPSHRDGA